MLAKKIATNSAVSAGARILGNVISLIIVGLIARTLPQAEVGQYFTVIAFLYTFSFLADLGLYSLLVRDISRPGADESKVVTTIFSLRVGALVVALAVGAAAVWLFPYSTTVKLAVVLGTLHMFFLSASQVLMGVFQKHLKLGRTAVAEIVGRAIQLAIVWYVIAHTDLGIIGLVVALIAAAGTSFVINAIGAHRLVPFGFRFDSREWLRATRAALPLGLSVILTALYFRLDTVMLSVFIGEAAVGVYNIGYRVLEAMIFFPAMFVGLLMPQLSNAAVSDKARFGRLFQRALDVLLVITVPAVVGLVMRASDIVTLLGGAQYAGSAPVLQILAGAIGMIFIGALLANSIIALNKQKLLAWIYAGGLAFNVAANFVVIPRHSFIGASWTTLGTEGLVTVLMAGVLVLSFSHTKQKLPSLMRLFPVVIAAATMGTFLALYGTLSLPYAIAGAAVIYGVVLVLFGGVKRTDFDF